MEIVKSLMNAMWIANKTSVAAVSTRCASSTWIGCDDGTETVTGFGVTIFCDGNKTDV